MKELMVRTISGVVFCAVTLASLVIAPYNPLPFLILFSFFLLRTDYEYLRLTMGKGKVVLKVVSLAAALCLFLGVASIGMVIRDFYAYMFLSALLVLAMAIPVVDLFEGEKLYMSFSLSSLLYVALPFSLLTLVSLQSGHLEEGTVFHTFFTLFYNGWAVASLLIVMWMGDVGAYCIGTAFGQGKRGHKLMPSVSPKKSWEGVYGAVAVSIATAIVLRAFGVLLDSYGYWLSALFGLVVCVFSILGDLVESKLKRRFQVKDSGRIMPGHGGFLDRFDSGLLAFPAAFLFYLLLYCLS
ncbi:MAG: phosphatidate cytidylyltransferase [Bacteroidales bacterium]|nr:phosphatidate cytidylyltransferase [Bacteroidales bacterium]